ncbi:MAG: methyl-accepting chemotaxis protein [Deferribacterales bacterium]
MFKSLTSKLLFFILCILATIFFAGGIYYYYFSANLEKSRAASMTKEINNSAEEAVKTYLNTLQALAITMSHNKSVIESLETGDVEPAASELAKIEAEYKSVDFKGTGFHIIGTDMHSFYRSFDERRGDDISFRSMIKTVLSTQQPISGVEIGKVGMGVRALSPIFGTSGDIIGIMEVTSGLSGISRKFEADKNFYIVLVDKGAVDAEAYMKKGSDVEVGQKYLTANKKWFNEPTVEWAKKAPLAELEKNGSAMTAEAVYGMHPVQDYQGKTYGVALVGTSRAEFDQRTATLSNAIKYMTLVGAMVVLIMITATMIVLRKIFISPVKRLGDFFSNMGTDLTVKFEYDKKDELGTVAVKLNEFISNFRDIVMEITRASGEVKSATGGINGMVDNVMADFSVLSQKSESIAASSQEMTATSTDIAKSCHMSASASNRTTSTTQQGIASVNEAVDRLMMISDRISETADVVSNLETKSGEIVNIISAIKDIADQTNLLALNAAIEAARAGEAGRGFAVVADEVRKLAEKSAHATTEIEAMLSGIRTDTETAVVQMSARVTEVKDGSDQADKAGENLTVILGQISEVSSQINQIAAAAEEQNVIIKGISDDIEEVSGIAKNSSSMVENLMTEAESMTQVTVKLENLVSRFKV